MLQTFYSLCWQNLIFHQDKMYVTKSNGSAFSLKLWCYRHTPWSSVLWHHVITQTVTVSYMLPSSGWNTKVVFSSKMLAITFMAAKCHNPGAHSTNLQYCKSFKSLTLLFCMGPVQISAGFQLAWVCSWFSNLFIQILVWHVNKWWKMYAWNWIQDCHGKGCI